MNKLSTVKRTQIISALVEGNSLGATARMCDVAFNTVLKLLPEIGRVCAEYQDKAFRNLIGKRIECDEIWSFCYAKAKNVTPEIAEKIPGAGDAWTWVAIESHPPEANICSDNSPAVQRKRRGSRRNRASVA